MSSKARIFEEASKFRAALELVSAIPNNKEFRGFPMGVCLLSSVNLGVHLNTLNSGEYRLVVAKRGLHVHVWLMGEELIIDITADQFDDQESKVIVESVGCSTWHDLWVINEVRSIDTQDMEICGVEDLSELMQSKGILEL